MHKFSFDAKPLIGWMRICRSGMVVGEQQQFLVRTQNRLRDIMRDAPSISPANPKAIASAWGKSNGYSRQQLITPAMSNSKK